LQEFFEGMKNVINLHFPGFILIFGYSEEDKKMKENFVKFLMTALFLCVITGCVTIPPVRDPQPSSFQYDSVSEKKIIIRVVDQRKDPDFYAAYLRDNKSTPKLAGVEDPIKWFTTALERELTARGIPVQVVAKDPPVAADITLNIKVYQIVSHVASGWSPYETYHSFKGELTAGDQTQGNIIAYFTNSHTINIAPFSGSTEKKLKKYVETLFNLPMSTVVKDVASKINQKIFKYQAGRDKLDKINARIGENIGRDQDEACYPAIELGATNNLDGTPTLVKLADHKDVTVRACALSAIGTLGAHNQLDFLKQKYAQRAYIDSFMALKSIGDIGTPAAVDFLKISQNDDRHQSERGFQYLIKLYLGD
jgi:uncharacterized lipoprotein YajG